MTTSTDGRINAYMKQSPGFSWAQLTAIQGLFLCLPLLSLFSLFLSGLNDSTKGNTRWNPLKYYLERHIELDGHEHGESAETLVIETVGESTDGWRKAEEAAIAALDERVRLWDSIHESIERNRT
mgnify:CR=1 FL=1